MALLDLSHVTFRYQADVILDDVTLAEWSHDPFAGKVVDGEIWGRGTIDNKLSVMSFLEAIEALIRDGFEPERSLYLSFGHDEEVGGQDGAKAVAEHLKEQGVEFEFVVDEGGAILDGIIQSVDRPVAMIGVAEKGYLNLRLRVDAPGGHSMSHMGRDIGLAWLDLPLTPPTE